MIIKHVFNIYYGRYLSVAVPWEDYPIPERHGFRIPTEKVYPCYDIRNRYMGFMDNGTFHEMREGWYCAICDFETPSFWKAVFHDIKHFFCVRKRKTYVIKKEEITEEERVEIHKIRAEMERGERTRLEDALKE